jgi:prepilin-type processing-associated H-X9-DG protein
MEQAGQGWGQPPRRRTSGLAIASLVLGILGLFTVGLTGLVGIILGVVALIQISGQRDRLAGQGIAIAGVATSGCMILLIPIMAAILFPVFARAREQARATHCMNNLHALGVAAQMYQNDWDGCWPLKENWADAISTFLKDREILSCPSAPEGAWGIEYNAELSGRWQKDLKNPDQVPAFFDGKGEWNASGPIADFDCRHCGGGYIAFADGSVRYTKKEERPVGPGSGTPPGGG